ncbi:MAG TPA: DUF1552 domain-containing protein, partial [Polyangia bacterium]
MPSTKFSRRSVLRGALYGTGITVGLPPLEAMFNANGTAHADGTALPKRLGIFFWGNGVKKDRWNPAAVGAGWALSPALMPLEPVKEYINVVSGTRIMTGNQQGHHAGSVGILSGCPMVVKPAGGAPFNSTFSAKSVDQVAADTIVALDPKFKAMKSLELGISTKINTREGTTLRYLSHNGPDNANPPEYSPAAVFTRLFGGFTPPTTGGMPVVDITRGLRRSVLDAVKTDFKSLLSRVSTFDKQRLDQHAENIRAIEGRLSTDTFLPASCKIPMKTTDPAAGMQNEPLEEKTKLMGDLLAVAFACDITRVFSMLYSGSTAFTVYTQVNIRTGHHDLTHNEGGTQPQVHASTEFTMKCFSALCQSLKAVPEGAGNLLDNSIIYGSSDTADGRAHDIVDYPIVLAGAGGGYFKKPGIHYRSSNENSSIVLFSVLRSIGYKEPAFGAGG